MCVCSNGNQPASPWFPPLSKTPPINSCFQIAVKSPNHRFVGGVLF